MTIELVSSQQEPSPPTGSGVANASGIISLYEQFSADLPSPLVFRQWTAVHAVGAAAKRQVWTQLGRNRLHPNLFVFLVGPPGVGKTQAIEPMAELLRKSTSVDLAPNDVTKQGLLDALGDCQRGALINGRPFDYHFMAISARELGNFMSKYDIELAGLLTDLFDCPTFNEEKKRSGAGKMLAYPGISLIAGTATENLGATISNEMWGSGFMARVINVFSADKIVPLDMFQEVKFNDTLGEEIVAGLRRVGDMVGPMIWEPQAQRLMLDFRITQEEGAPLHNRLTSYVVRRWLHLAKLIMVAALSDERMVVLEEDYYLARSWLLAAEHGMTEMFKDMATHEDGQIYEELRSAMFAIHMADRRPLDVSLLYKWLSTRVSTHSVERAVQIAVAADYFRRVAGEDDLYIPQMPKFSGKNLGVL